MHISVFIDPIHSGLTKSEGRILTAQYLLKGYTVLEFAKSAGDARSSEVSVES